MKRHLSLSNLLGFLKGELAAREAAEVAQHLEQPCSRCLADRAWLERLLEVARSDRSVSAAEGIIRQSIALFGWLGPKKKGFWGKVFALKPRFDSALVPQPMGLRGGTAAPRRLLFEIGPLDLDLEVVRGAREHTADVQGQLRHRDLGAFPGMEIRLLRGNKKVASCPCGTRGEFAFSEIRAADYRMEAQLGKRRFALKSVPLRSSGPCSDVSGRRLRDSD